MLLSPRPDFIEDCRHGDGLRLEVGKGQREGVGFEGDGEELWWWW